MSEARAVITGFGQVSPLGIDNAECWKVIKNQQSCIRPLESIPRDVLPTSVGGEARQFTGHIDEFGVAEKARQRTIRKGMKLMCREISMGVAAAQHALNAAGLAPDDYLPERSGCVYGSDYIMSRPEEFADAVAACRDQKLMRFDRWGQSGIPKVDPLWLLKYLPNMPASHVAIYNDLRGPSNSITMREASSNLAVAEGLATIRRGAADLMLCGSTGTRVHPIRSVHVALQEKLADDPQDPAKASRPFDQNRDGMVIGEGAGVLVLESLEHAQKRGATIWGEVLMGSSSTVGKSDGTVDFLSALRNVIDDCLDRLDSPHRLGHVHAHGLSNQTIDLAEAQAIEQVLGSQEIPVTALKSYFGNLGAGSGIVEIIASLQAIQDHWLFPILNYETPDPDCPIRAATAGDDPGDSFLNLNITPQGQASAVLIQRWTD